MRYRKSIKEKVRKLRTSGLGLNQISKTASVPKSTIRLWISDIKLSPEQKLKLKNKALVALQKGRLTAQKINLQKRINKEESLLAKGTADIGKLSKKELFVAGVALYWAEGFKNKHEKRLGFCNSDPEMILFYLKWLKQLGIDINNITARVSLNASFKDQELSICKYWSRLTHIPLNQFTKTFYQQTAWKKQYQNNGNYHGVLRIHVKESLEQLLIMKGWILGLKTQAKRKIV